VSAAAYVDPEVASARKVIGAEQLRNARRVHRVRFLGVSAFFLLFLVLGGLLHDKSWQGNLVPFALYWAASIAVVLATRTDGPVARALTLATAVIDMPFIFWVQLANYPTTPNPGATAGYSLGLFLLLFVLAALSLATWQLYLTAAIGAVFEMLLQYYAGISVGAMVSTAVVMGLAAALMNYGSARMRELLASTARREKLAALGQISAGIGHDLRNPLSAVSTSVFVLQRRLDKLNLGEEPKLKEVMTLATKGVAACNAIITDLLDFARERPLELSPTRLDGVVKDSLEVVKRREHVQLETRALEALPEVLLEREKFQRVVVNLVQNAVEAIPEGRPGRVTVQGATQADRVLLEVVDDGEGIGPEKLERIFEPLFTTKKEGTGLGLAIVESLVRQHGATLTVKSAVGQGTTFTVALPLPSRAAAP